MAHVTRHMPHVTRHMPHVTRHMPHVTRHTSHVTRHTSHVTRHTSHVTRHTSHVTRHTSHVTRHTVLVISHHIKHQSHKRRPASNELNSSLSFSAAAAPVASGAAPRLPIPTKSNRDDSSPAAAAWPQRPAAGAVRSLKASCYNVGERNTFSVDLGGVRRCSWPRCRLLLHAVMRRRIECVRKPRMRDL
jgi:hypothetical protein